MRYTTPHSMAMVRGFRPRIKSLDAFYDWCKSIGHYRYYEAVERFRRIVNDAT